MRTRELSVPGQLRKHKPVRDALFDRVYPTEVQRVSARYWTPVDVALTGARWLDALGCRRVLDVGAGAGKFCIVASLVLGRTVTGLEQRQPLVEIGRAAADSYEADVEYLHGTLEDADPSGFDAFYLFNPFGENLYAPSEQLDADAELSALRWQHDVSVFQHWLEHAALGTCVLTYHGFGGGLPADYVQLRSMPKGSDHLRLWKKAAPR